MSNNEGFVYITFLLIGGAFFAFRNRKHSYLSGISNWELWSIIAGAMTVSILVGLVEKVSPPSIIAGLLLAPVFGFFAREIASFLWRSVKYLTRLVLRESFRGLKGKKKNKK